MLRLQALRSTAKPYPSQSTSAFHSHARRPNTRPLKLSRSQSTVQSRRHASTLESARLLYRKNPISTTLATISILAGMLGLAYVNYFYRNHIILPYSRYPEPVAKALRKAIYWTNMDLQPRQALKYYKQALQTAAELGMDPFSDEVLGIRIEVAFMFEKAGMMGQSVKVLEGLRGECVGWLEERKGSEEGLGKVEGVQEGDDEEVKMRRGRKTEILRKAVRTSAKLGDLYSDQRLDDPGMAEERLVWAVTMLLREQKRREDEGVKEGEGEWFANDEVGAALESLGTHYTSQQKHYLAAPLFLQALGISGGQDCHAVVLMNNLAAALALQNPGSAPGQPPASGTQQLDDASTWARKALKLGQGIQPPQRTEECDEGCAVATINLGDFAAMGGNALQARDYYAEGRSLSKAIGFKDGVRKADEALRDLSKKK